MPENLSGKQWTICAICFCGIFLRFLVMSSGHNFDFESFCIVGDISSKLNNVYAETSRYNYAPVFFCILGICYWLSQLMAIDFVLTFRIFIVGILTFTDLLIMKWISEKYSLRAGLIFFLNPVSIIITGYHNQFDNIAVLMALLSCNFYNEEEEFNKKDIFFIAFLTMSLLVKHLLYIFPFWILVKKHLPLKKKFAYVFIPPLIFLLGFLPFALNSQAAFHGIINNVFLYRSFNNAPLLSGIFQFFKIPVQYWFIIFICILAAVSLIVRGQTYEYMILIYLVSVVAFSSAIANQYLVIPAAAVCVLSKKVFRYSYFVLMGIYLALDQAGLGLLQKLENRVPDSVCCRIAGWIQKEGYCIGACILAALLIMEFLKIFNAGKLKNGIKRRM